MRFAYADPPYLGLGKMYADRHAHAMEWNDPETHRRLIVRLCDEYPDGWALSLHVPSLHIIRSMCPDDTRVGAWVKPFCSFKRGVGVAYAWEPLLFRGGRKRALTERTVRDWCAANITLQRNFPGAKPREFCRWVFDLLGARRGDILDDLFPGSGAVGAAWSEWIGQPSPLDPTPIEAACT
jgi:hypothetical protein